MDSCSRNKLPNNVYYLEHEREAYFSPIGSPSIMTHLSGSNHLDPYILFLAQEILRHPARYAQLASGIRNWSKSDEVYIIVDNGAAEGERVGYYDLARAALIVGANAIAMPDVIGDAERTLDGWSEGCKFVDQFATPMMIPQGKTEREILQCIDTMAAFNTARIHYWGIPRWFANTFGSREIFVKHAYQTTRRGYGRMVAIHLLGCSDKIMDDFACARLPGVVGMDSANPVVLGYYSQVLQIEPKAYVHKPRPNGFMVATLASPCLEFVELNVDMMRNGVR